MSAKPKPIRPPAVCIRPRPSPSRLGPARVDALGRLVRSVADELRAALGGAVLRR